MYKFGEIHSEMNCDWGGEGGRREKSRAEGESGVGSGDAEGRRGRKGVWTA